MNANEPLMNCRKEHRRHQNRSAESCSGKGIAATCLLAVRCPALRWHESYLGSDTEHGKLDVNAKGKAQAHEREAEYRCGIQWRTWLYEWWSSCNGGGAKDRGHSDLFIV